MGTAVLELDHLAYLAERPYRRLTHARLRRLRRGQVTHLVVLHEADGSCCRRQPWDRTLARLLGEIEADGGLVG